MRGSPDAKYPQRHLQEEETGEGEADDGQLVVQVTSEVGQVDDHYRDVDQDENEHEKSHSQVLHYPADLPADVAKKKERIER